MKKTVLKSAKKINRKPLKHARKSDILADQFENMEGLECGRFVGIEGAII